MSLKTYKDKDNKSVTKLTTYSHTQHDSFSRDSEYEQQFTLMIKPTQTQIKKKRENCLALKIAQRYPPKIREQVTKMVNYYEDLIQNQTFDYHKLVQENARLRKQNQQFSAQILRNEIEKDMKTPNKKSSVNNQILKSNNLNRTDTKQSKTPLKVVLQNKTPTISKYNQSPKFPNKKQVLPTRQIKTKGRQNLTFRNV